MTYPNVFIFDHPLIKHKVSILRDKNTSMKEFRELVEEITTIMTYESMRDVELVPVEVDTPLEKTTQYRVADDSVAIVPILRDKNTSMKEFRELVEEIMTIMEVFLSRRMETLCLMSG